LNDWHKRQGDHKHTAVNWVFRFHVILLSFFC
jgi:hypothetical protein